MSRERRNRQASFLRNSLDNHGHREIGEARVASLLVAVDGPEHGAFGDARELEPVLKQSHRARRWVAAVGDHFQHAFALLIGLGAAHSDLEDFDNEREVLAIERDELRAPEPAREDQQDECAVAQPDES